MKRLAVILILLSTLSCGDKAVEKPDNLIAEDKMIDVLYDLSVLEAIRSQKPAVLDSNHVDVSNYVYKKHKIDSLQFASSTQYYASDIDNYKQMYEKVAAKLDDKKAVADSIIKRNGGKVNEIPDAPQIQ